MKKNSKSLSELMREKKRQLKTYFKWRIKWFNVELFVFECVITLFRLCTIFDTFFGHKNPSYQHIIRLRAALSKTSYL